MERTKKLVVGMFVGICLVLFGVGLFLIGNSNQLFTKSFAVYADFSKVTGIQNGGKVRVGGMDAGTVTNIEVPSRPDGKFRIHVRIIEKLHPIVRRDSVATIQTDGLLGSKYLQVDAGSTDAPLAANHSRIESKEPFDWGDLMDEINGVVKQVNGVMTDVREQVVATLSQIESVAKSADGMIKGASPDVQSILASANKISTDVSQIMDGIQAGEGTVGALFKDKKLYASVNRSVAKTEEITENLRAVSASVRNVAGTVDKSDIVPELQRTVKNLQQITSQVKAAVDKFQSASGEGGVAENLQKTLAGAHEAMSDLSDNTEALKHSFFFRGFFKKRGFFDLAALTTNEYKSPAFAKGFKRQRIWMEKTDLFQPDSKGIEVLSPAGKARLDEAMTALLEHPRNGPLMVEGFAGKGTASQQYLLGRRRAVSVQTYLITRFHLRPAYVGIVSLTTEPAVDGTAAGSGDGIGIVAFYK